MEQDATDADTKNKVYQIIPQGEDSNKLDQITTEIQHEKALLDRTNSVISDTFIKNQDEEERLLFPKYEEVVYRCLTQKSQPRFLFLKLISSPWFDKISLFVIMINCIIMGLYNPCQIDECTNFKCVFLKYIDDLIYIFFLAEMLIKMIAMGLYGKMSYFAETWNRLDCFIVIAGALDYMPFLNGTGITTLRTIRVLRPLRVINKAPNLRILVTLIIDTLPMLGNVCALALLVFVVFGIVGVQLWMGLLRNRCFSTLNTFNSTLNTTTYTLFYTPQDDDFICTTGNGMQTCNNIPPEFSDLHYTVCRKSEVNPFDDSISFDNMGYAFIAIFQIVTLESWTPIMYHVQNVYSQYAWIYFVLVIVIGSFFLVNMVLVVISVQFSVTKERETALMNKERLQAGSSFSSFEITPSKNIWEVTLSFIGQTFEKYFNKLFGLKHRKNSSVRQYSTVRNTTTIQFLCCCCFDSISKTSVFENFCKLREKVKMHVLSNGFQNFVFGAIMVNSFFMASEFHNQPVWWTKVVDISNYVFTFVFFFEMLLKLFGLGIVDYIRNLVNIFDALIVAISIFELISGSESSGVSVFRTFRLLRLLKLFSFIRTLRRQILIMVKTLDNVATFFLLLFLFMFIFSTLGMQIFGCKFYELNENTGEKVVDRKNFDSFFWSIITVFQILTQEDWNAVMYTGMEKTSAWASVYFILLMVIGNYFLFSLLVAILVEGFSEVPEEQSSESVIKPYTGFQTKLTVHEFNENKEMQNFINNDNFQDEVVGKENLLENNSQKSNIQSPVTDEIKRGDYSCYLFSDKSSFRQKCINTVTKPWFTNIIFIVIFVNCITLAMENPSISPEDCKRHMLNKANFFFTFIFTIEAIMKIIAFGFIQGKNSYLRDRWNLVDFSLVIASLADIIITVLSKNDLRALSLLKILRIMRTLRPLRAINKAPGLKLVVTSLLSSLKPIGNTVLITIAFFIIFAILGVQMFKGKMYYCDTEDLTNITTRADCEAKNFEWVNKVYNYDNIFNALFTLFIIATRDGWVDAMYDGIDAVGVDMQPIINYNEYMAIFFVVYLLVVGFFVVNMFVGVIIDNFHKAYDNQEVKDSILEAEKMKENKNTSCKVEYLQQYYATYPQWRKKLNTIICHPYFDLFIAGVILLNIVAMSVEYYMMPKLLIDVLEIFNYIFTSIFLVEAIIRMIALGPVRYLKDWWNILDLMIVIISIATIVINIFYDSNDLPIDPTAIRVIRIFRIARTLKLIKTAKGIQSLLNTIRESMLQVGNLALLFGLFFFIYSTLGVELFGKIQCDSRYGECGGINKHTNFNTFGGAILTLFRITTGDAWSEIMKDTMKNNIVCMQKPYMNETFVDITSNNIPQEWCLYSLIAPVYFLTFVLAAQFILMNLVIGVLMKELEEAHKIVSETYEINLEQEKPDCGPKEESSIGAFSESEKDTFLTTTMKPYVIRI